MKVRVADATRQDLDARRPGIAALEGERRERRLGTGGGVAGTCEHGDAPECGDRAGPSAGLKWDSDTGYIRPNIALARACRLSAPISASETMQDNAMISGLADANAVVLRPAGAPALAAEALIEAIRLDPIAGLRRGSSAGGYPGVASAFDPRRLSDALSSIAESRRQRSVASSGTRRLIAL